MATRIPIDTFFMSRKCEFIMESKSPELNNEASFSFRYCNELRVEVKLIKTTIIKKIYFVPAYFCDLSAPSGAVSLSSQNFVVLSRPQAIF